MAGVTEDGFVTKTLAEIKAEIEAEFRATFGNEVDLTADSAYGQLIGIFANREAASWELAEAVYNAAYPNSATGIALDNVCSIVGVFRKAATATTCEVLIDATNGTVIPEGALVRSNGFDFALDDEFTSAGDPVSCPFTCTTTGPNEINTSDDPTIVNPVSGWDGASFVGDGEQVLGRDVESDEELRLRRARTVAAVGSSTLQAILAAVLAVDGVIDARVFENTTDEDDIDGIPPHAFEVLVLGGEREDIAQAIFDNKPAGILAHGLDTPPTVIDGVTIKFSRPTEVPIEFAMTVTPIDGEFPDDGVDQIKATLAAFVNGLGVGKDVVLRRAERVVFDVSGVYDVIDFEDAQVGDTLDDQNIVLTNRMIATCDVADINITTNAAIDPEDT